VFRRRTPDHLRIDLGTYAFFVAQICHIVNEFTCGGTSGSSRKLEPHIS
jgi:hypothetical protein